MEPKSSQSASRVIDAGPLCFVFRFPYNAALVEAVGAATTPRVVNDKIDP